MKSKHRVVIVGGGFGGLYAAKSLANKNVDVILIDKKNHHTFQPLLYQVATTVLSPSQIAAPLRHILRKAKNVEVLLGEVVDFNLTAKKVRLSDLSEISFDSLIIAAGARHSYFGHDDWEANAPGLKTLEDATEMRRRILKAFEDAERQAYFSNIDVPVSFAIVGGGPTGVELAGAIAGIARQALVKDFRMINTRRARVMLFEGTDRVLGMFAPELSSSAERQLQDLGVEVYLNSMVTSVEPDRIRVGDEWIAANVTLWATGVAASPLGKLIGAPVDRAGRVLVNPDLTLPNNPDVSIIGDMVSLKDTKGVVVPGLGSAAMQMGYLAATNILRRLDGQPPKLFTYKDKGSMATIGRNRAIAQVGALKLSGFIAWLAWCLVHVLLLIGFKSKVLVLLEWAWSYVSGSGSVRLITGNGSVREIRVPEDGENPAAKKPRS